MTPVVRLLVIWAAVATAAALPQRSARADNNRPATQFLCQRPECSCSEQEGLEMVSCDCGNDMDTEPLLLGHLSAFVSDRTRSLRVRRCPHVTLVPEALSRAVSLTELELSDIGRLMVQDNSLYTHSGPSRRIVVRDVAELSVTPHAFGEVTVLQRLELTNVTADELPLDSFDAAADVIALRLADSRVRHLSLLLPKADTVSVSNCSVDAMDLEVTDVLSVEVADSRVESVEKLRFNDRENPHSNDNNTVAITGNTIGSLDTSAVRMTVDLFRLNGNTIASLDAPLRVDFATAEVVGNTIDSLGPGVFAPFLRLEALDIRFRPASTASSGLKPAPLAFTFAENAVRASSNGSLGLFLDSDDPDTALYRVYGNRFGCGCAALHDLVQAGERAFLAAANATEPEDDDGLETAEEVYGALYTTSECLEGGQPLTQYRLAAYDADFGCLEEERKQDRPDSGAAPAAGVMTLLLAATAAAGVIV